MTLYQIFRCWTVYSRSWQIAVLPLLLLLYNISVLLVVIYWAVILPIAGNESSFLNESNVVISSYFAAIIAINIYATCKWIDLLHSMILIQNEIKGAIIFRIWRTTSLSRRRPRFARFSIRVIAESGLLYTITSIVVLCTMILNCNDGYAIASPIVCHQWIESCQDCISPTHCRIIALQGLLFILYWYGWHKIGLWIQNQK